MANIMCQVRIPHRSLITADDVVNTFNFVGLSDAETMAPLALGLLADFYGGLNGIQIQRIKDMLSGELAVAGTRIKVYDHADPEPRVPILDESLGLTNATNAPFANLPGEVAIGISYHAEQVSGVAAARRRGRIYLGPLRNDALAGTGTTPSRPPVAMLVDLAQAARGLASGPSGCRWAVYSRRDEAFREIVGGHIDNAFDTQRRRGVETTLRQGFTAGPA